MIYKRKDIIGQEETFEGDVDDIVLLTKILDLRDDVWVDVNDDGNIKLMIDLGYGEEGGDGEETKREK